MGDIKTLDVRGLTLDGKQTQGTEKMADGGAAKQAKVTAAINDVIAVTKAGFLNYRVVVYNSDTANIQIKMIVCADTVRDIDGNLYQAVRIGNQVWTVENLRVTRYNDGTAIAFDSSYLNSTWAYATTPKYCFYKNTMIPDSIKKYGALYNWYVVNQSNPKEIAPAGWHIPTNAEWDTLQNYLIKNGYNWDGTTTGNTIAKSMAAKTDWMTDTSLGVIGNNLTKNNSSGFSALPGGYRSSAGGNFLSQGSFGNWWSVTAYTTTNAWGCGLTSNQDYLDRGDGNKGCGLSVRLVKD